MSHVVAAVENALLGGRWKEAAPLLSELLAGGEITSFRPVEFYEQSAGQPCTDDSVRQILTRRLVILDSAQSRFKVYQQWFQAERLAKFIREHGMPCRVIDSGCRLRVASQAIMPTGKWKWHLYEMTADVGEVRAWLGYGN